jgi:Tfp pilus assembly protein PilF
MRPPALLTKYTNCPSGDQTGFTLHDTGRPAGARRILEQAAARHQHDGGMLGARVALSREAGDEAAARRWESRLPR